MSSRPSVHSGVLDSQTILAPQFEHHLAAQARGVTRKNVPVDKFESLYLLGFAELQEKTAILSPKSIQGIGSQTTWGEKKFFNRLKGVLSAKAMDVGLSLTRLNLSYAATASLRDSDLDKEPVSKPDFLLHRISDDGDTPRWQDVELLMEHTKSENTATKVTEKFMQWLRNAWNTFHHQPFRRHLYGILFVKPCAYICYADHGTAAYSEALNFETFRHAEVLASFLSAFITRPDLRGSDPTVCQVDQDLRILHGGKWWTEHLQDGPLWYRPCVVGRNIRVALVSFEGEVLVMKSVWEEKLPEGATPPAEPLVLRTLEEKGVRGLPQTYHLDDSVVRREDGSEVLTCDFTTGCEVAVTVKTDALMEKIDSSFILAPGMTKGVAAGIHGGMRRVDKDKAGYNEPLMVRRQLTRIVMSYCRPLKEHMRFCGPRALMKSLRDAMIVYYEAYKIGGFIHGDVSIENILVPLDTTQLTGGCTDRVGTLVDWNLCFNADGTASNRNFRSGTPAFMSPHLLSNEPVARRTLAHDLESFFAVAIWMASYVHQNEQAFREKPLAQHQVLDAGPFAIGIAKKAWFKDPREFKKEIIEHMERPFRTDTRFCLLLVDLRDLLHPPEGSERIRKELMQGDTMATEKDEVTDAKENVFKEAIRLIDGYLGDKKGVDELSSIDLRAVPAPKPEPESA